MKYRIQYLESVVRRDIPRLSAAAKRRIRTAIDRKLSSHPVEFGKPLRYSFRGARRLRVGDYRVIYTIEPPDVVLVVKIGHRRDVYEEEFPTPSLIQIAKIARSSPPLRGAGLLTRADHGPGSCTSDRSFQIAKTAG